MLVSIRLPILRTPGVLPLYRRFANRRFYSSRLTHLQTHAIARRPLHTAMQKPLDFYDGPLVWIDCEMTGLDPRKDKILEIAVSRIWHVSQVDA